MGEGVTCTVGPGGCVVAVLLLMMVLVVVVVLVGSSSDLVIQPWGALVIGFCAGALSVVGYVYISPWLERKIGLHDTCGIHNLHGMPGVMGAIGGAFSALVAGDQAYGDSIGTVFPNRDPPTYEIAIQQKQCNATQVQEGKCALGLTAGEQAGRQVSALLITLALSIASSSSHLASCSTTAFSGSVLKRR